MNTDPPTGKVCLLTSISKGVATTRCARTTSDRETFTGWASGVTCPTCKGTPT